jgi:hypothetical protein
MKPNLQSIFIHQQLWCGKWNLVQNLQNQTQRQNWVNTWNSRTCLHKQLSCGKWNHMQNLQNQSERRNWVRSCKMRRWLPQTAMMWKVEPHAKTCTSKVRGGTEWAVGIEKMAPTRREERKEEEGEGRGGQWWREWVGEKVHLMDHNERWLFTKERHLPRRQVGTYCALRPPGYTKASN